jgi:cytochrome P450
MAELYCWCLPAETVGDPELAGRVYTTGMDQLEHAARGSLADPELFAGGPPHELLAELRRTSPVSWQPMDGEPGFFAVLSYDDVLHVSREPNLFSASEGGITLEDGTPEALAMSRDMLVVMDPPRHTGYRKPLVPSFKPRVIGELEGRVRIIARDIMRHGREIGPELEFVHQVSALMPSRVMGQLMGLPKDDWPYVHDLSERMLASQDPDVAADEGDRGSMLELAGYAMNFAAKRRTQELPATGPDVTTVLLQEDFNGRRMTDMDFASFFVQLVGAGNDTTKTLTSSGLLALLQHPEQLAELRADPSLIAGAVEEMLRWENPVHYMRRTATADTQLSGVPIAAGQKVAMYYTSANRDESAFTGPQSFGFAEHFCLGAHLARLEARVFFEELLSAFPAIELAGEPIRLRSNFINGYRHIPVRMMPS